MMTGPRICEVGPRDGLQNEPGTQPPAIRAELANRVARSGVGMVEVASFVDDRRVPAMAGAEEVVAGLDAGGEVLHSGLVLNERGYQRLAATRLREVTVAFCVTETFNRRNQGSSVDESVDSTLRMIKAAHDDGRMITVTLAASFGCPFEGEVDPAWPIELAARLSSADQLCFADTIGVGSPRQVRALLDGSSDLGVPVGLHLHNSRSTGYANAYEALNHGVAWLDSSLGGIGGCPFAPGAAGNLATEDLVYLLEREGVNTGVDHEALLDSARWLAVVLGRPLPGQLHQAGWFPGSAATVA